jgi:hypothetical protein
LPAGAGSLEALLLSRLLLHTDVREGVSQPLVADDDALWRGRGVSRTGRCRCDEEECYQADSMMMGHVHVVEIAQRGASLVSSVSLAS